MKALSPTLKNKIIFALLFNIFMLFVYYVSDIDITWKSLGGTNFIIVCFFLNWLPKAPSEMDEREKNEYIKAGNTLFSITLISFVTALMIHLIWFEQMTIPQYFFFSVIPMFIATSFYSYRFKKEFSVN